MTFLVFDEGHWVSGLIQVDEVGKARVLVTDSLGISPEVAFGAVAECFMAQFESIDLFYSDEKRQQADAGCSVFALDDARHLQTVHRYLPPKYADTGVFGYLADHSDKSALETLIPDFQPQPEKTFFRARLPLHLMRTMQSRKLLDEVVPQRDERLPVNKRGESAVDSSVKHFTSKAGEKPRNTRLEYKLHKMRDQNIAYLNSHTDDECKAAMDALTVSGFKKRVDMERVEHLQPEHKLIQQNFKSQLAEVREKESKKTKESTDPHADSSPSSF